VVLPSTIPGRIATWKCWFLRRGKKRSTRRKLPGENPTNKTQPTYVDDAGTWSVGGRRVFSPLGYTWPQRGQDPPHLSLHRVGGKQQSLTSSKTACSLTNCTCSALSIPLLMFNTWGGSSGWARISVIRPRSVLNTRSWASSSSAKAVDPRDTWYFKGPGFLLCASQSSTVSSWKERKKYQQAFLELRVSLKIYP